MDRSKRGKGEIRLIRISRNACGVVNVGGVESRREREGNMEIDSARRKERKERERASGPLMQRSISSMEQ